VKIFGENPEADGSTEADPDSFTSKPRLIQASVLVAGVFMNFLFAWLLISLGFLSGLPASVDSGLPVQNTYTTVTEIVPNSPAAAAGLKSGDKILSVGRNNIFSNTAPDQISNFIASSPDPVTFNVSRDGQSLALTATPSLTVVPDKLAVGVGLDEVGVVKLGIFQAIWQGLKTTASLTWLTFTSLIGFIKDAFVGHANLSEVTGPVGIVGLVGDARHMGFIYLVSLTALISINLSIINLLPIPALDGGRLLFVAIEGIRRKKISPKVFNVVNGISFALLILLMIIVTVRDVVNLF
jgi:regulator of sigma E protease